MADFTKVTRELIKNKFDIYVEEKDQFILKNNNYLIGVIEIRPVTYQNENGNTIINKYSSGLNNGFNYLNISKNNTSILGNILGFVDLSEGDNAEIYKLTNGFQFLTNELVKNSFDELVDKIVTIKVSGNSKMKVKIRSPENELYSNTDGNTIYFNLLTRDRIDTNDVIDQSIIETFIELQKEDFDEIANFIPRHNVRSLRSYAFDALPTRDLEEVSKHAYNIPSRLSGGHGNHLNKALFQFGGMKNLLNKLNRHWIVENAPDSIKAFKKSKTILVRDEGFKNLIRYIKKHSSKKGYWNIEWSLLKRKNKKYVNYRIRFNKKNNDFGEDGIIRFFSKKNNKKCSTKRLKHNMICYKGNKKTLKKLKKATKKLKLKLTKCSNQRLKKWKSKTRKSRKGKK